MLIVSVTDRIMDLYVGVLVDGMDTPFDIMEYGSTPYVGMALIKNGLPIKCV